jgi:formylglycine-generating enzyme required for sulfatase activity
MSVCRCAFLPNGSGNGRHGTGERHGYSLGGPLGDWRAGVANSREAGLGRPTAVGMYPHGAAACKALDMAGNLREWCANNFDDQNVNYDIE